LDIVVQVGPHPVPLLVGDDLQVRVPLLVQDGMRTPQNSEIDPAEVRRPQLWTDIVPEDAFRQIGVTSVVEGKTQSFGPFTGSREIQDLSRSRISSGTPTVLWLFGVFGGS